MTINDLIDSFGSGSIISIFYDEVCMLSRNVHTTEFHRAYGNLFGCLMGLLLVGQLTCTDLHSIWQSIIREISVN